MRKKDCLIYVMGLLYVAAGINHFVHPDFYIKMIPFLPEPKLLNNLSGIFEIVLGAGVIFRSTRRASAYGLIALLITVFPANVYMALNWQLWGESPLPLIIRLPFQPLLIWWAWQYTGKPREMQQ